MSTLIALYFLLPKVDLFQFIDFSAGIRAQDLIALCLACRLFVSNKKFFFSFPVLLYIFLNIFSAYFRGGGIASFVAWLRIFEYYLIGVAIYKYCNIITFRNIFFVQVLVAFSQYFLILPNIDPGRGVIFSEEYSGTFGTPAEFSYFFALVFLLYLRDISLLSHMASIPFVTLNGVKAPILLPLINLYDRISLGVRVKAFLFLGGVLLFVYIYIHDFVFFGDFVIAINSIDFSGYDHNYFNGKEFIYANASLPRTLEVRLTKWGVCLALILNSNIFEFLIGNGLYLVGGALDSGILRFIYELGILPLTYFAIKLFRKDLVVLFGIFFANLFFDAWISSVTAPLIVAIYLRSQNE